MDSSSFEPAEGDEAFLKDDLEKPYPKLMIWLLMDGKLEEDLYV